MKRILFLLVLVSSPSFAWDAVRVTVFLTAPGEKPLIQLVHDIFGKHVANRNVDKFIEDGTYSNGGFTACGEFGVPWVSTTKLDALVAELKSLKPQSSATEYTVDFHPGSRCP